MESASHQDWNDHHIGTVHESTLCRRWKHNYVLQTVLPYIARAIGKALIAPIVKFVPEGNIEPTTTGHMQYAGTISVESATFEALLTDMHMASWTSSCSAIAAGTREVWNGWRTS